MARNETRHFSFQHADRAHPRAGAASWRALASVTVASTLVVAVVVSALALAEAILTRSAPKLARPSPATVQSVHAQMQAH